MHVCRSGLALSIAALLALCSARIGRAQEPAVTPAPAPAPTAAPTEPVAPPALTTDQRIEQLTRELEAQRQAFEARLAKVEAEAAEAKAQSEAAALLNDAGAEDLELSEPVLRVYGFADVGLQRSWGPIAELIPGGTTKTTFVLGNVNLYFDANPIPDWRFLSEVRFGLFPHGATDRSATGAAPTIDTTVGDDGSPNGGFTNIQWNGVLLERAHIDWTPRDEIGLRAGWFLTPYGIWNVDHGTPTRIMVEAPLLITTEILPQRQLGIEAFGRVHALPWTFGYHLYVSNGRQPGQLDFSDQKAVGTRVWLQTRHPFPMTFGLSGYTGRYEEVNKVFGLRGGNFAVSQEELVAFTDYAFGADASLDVGQLRIRAEGVTRWKIFEDGKRTSYLPGTFDASQNTFGAYVLAAYRLPWYGLEPLVQTEIFRFSLPLGEYALRPSAGLNIYFDPAVVLRFSYTYSRLFDLDGPERTLSFNYLHSLAARLSIAF